MRIRTAAAALALAAVAVLGVAGPASAHDQLLSTTPADGSSVDALPAEVTLTFNDTVTDAGGEANQVRVLDASCQVLDDGALSIQDNVVSQAISGSATGPVHVLWRVVSRDGHPVSGEFTFTVAGGEASAPQPSRTCDTAASAAPAPTAGQGVTPLPWIIGGIIVVIVIAGVAYLLVTRSRRTDDH
nr:copper resistance CopC family protein [Microbacterium bovistercoris]